MLYQVFLNKVYLFINDNVTETQMIINNMFIVDKENGKKFEVFPPLFTTPCSFSLRSLFFLCQL